MPASTQTIRLDDAHAAVSQPITCRSGSAGGGGFFIEGVTVGELTKNDLPEMDNRDRRVVLKLLEQFAAAKKSGEAAYWEIARCCDHVRQTGVYSYWGTLEEAWKQLFGISGRRGYQLVEALEVRGLLCTVVQKDNPFYQLFQEERICREITKVPTEQQRADVIAGLAKVVEVDQKPPTASMAAAVRRELHPDGKLAVDPLASILKTVEGLRKRVETLAEKHRPESQSWDTALGHLEGMRQAFERLGK